MNASARSLLNTIGRLLDAIETLKYITAAATATEGNKMRHIIDKRESAE
jgi:hypothetical protein